MASVAGTILIDASGNIQLDSAGKVRISNGTSDGCCCTACTCVTGISPVGAYEPLAGGSVVVAVSCASSCVWTATASDGHLSLSGASGTGPGSFTVTTAALVSGTYTGSVTICDKVFPVQQYGNGDGSCPITPADGASTVAYFVPFSVRSVILVGQPLCLGLVGGLDVVRYTDELVTSGIFPALITDHAYLLVDRYAGFGGSLPYVPCPATDTDGWFLDANPTEWHNDGGDFEVGFNPNLGTDPNIAAIGRACGWVVDITVSCPRCDPAFPSGSALLIYRGYKFIGNNATGVYQTYFDWTGVADPLSPLETTGVLTII